MTFTRSLVPCLLTMAIVSYCGGLSQSGARWSPYLEIHFESVDPTEMRSEFGLLGCILNIDSTGNCLPECSVRFIYIQHRAVLGWIFGDRRAVGSDGLRVVCNRLYFQGGNREFNKTLCWGSDFGLLGCILNIDSPENRLVECSVRFTYIQHRAALGWLFGDGRDVGSDSLRVVCNRLYFQGGNREFDKTTPCGRRRNWKWLQPLTTAVVRRWWESRLTLPVHNLGQCQLSWCVCARLRKVASRIVGFVQISRSWKDFAVKNGKFVLTVNSIKTLRMRAKTWLILLGKQFRSVTQPRDKRDTESWRSADNLASLQTSSHSVYQAITFTSSLTERFDSQLKCGSHIRFPLWFTARFCFLFHWQFLHCQHYMQATAPHICVLYEGVVIGYANVFPCRKISHEFFWKHEPELQVGCVLIHQFINQGPSIDNGNV